MIYVWAMEQKEKKFTEQDNFVPWHLQKKFENETKVETLENGPNIIEDKNINSKVYQRYYHVFYKGELEDLINKQKPDILCIQEIKTKNVPKLEGYECCPYPSSKSSGYYGTAIYTKIDYIC